MSAHRILLLSAAAAAIAASVVTAANYNDWFVTPKLTEEKRSHAVQQMRDPAAVQFRNERLTEGGWLCGELNGRNAYGAYVGFKRFMARAYDDAWIEGSGFAGKPDSRTTDQIIQDLGDTNHAMRSIKETRKMHGPENPPSGTELSRQAEQLVFENRWQKHCR